MPDIPSTDFAAIGSALAYLKAAGQPIRYSLAGRLIYSYGWLMLTVPASLVRGAYDALHEPGVELPKQLGIPVMTPQELMQLGGADKITERGHQYAYSLGPVHEERGDGNILRSYYLEVTSPALKTLRTSYGLDLYPGKLLTFKLPIGNVRRGTLKPGDGSKLAACLEDFDPAEFDISAP